MCLLTVYLSIKRGYRGGEKAGPAARLEAFRKAFPILLMPLIVLGGIYSGIFSPTQAAAVACIYSLPWGRSSTRASPGGLHGHSLVETVR